LTSDRKPRHVAIIMDGNGRWARAQGMPRIEGHRRGAEVVRDITTYNRELGVPFLTLYSFSVQNWSRPDAEVAGLMALLEEFCVRERDTLMDNDIRLMSIGRLDRLPPSTLRALSSLMEESCGNRSMRLTLALDYGGREELVRAMRSLAGRHPDAITETAISRALDTHDLPDPDLLIRTSGELRLSNFLLWQSAYSEFYFSAVPWPLFTRDEYLRALTAYGERSRRYGALDESC
jgi:undecaprenyl diphosphate synthase